MSCEAWKWLAILSSAGAIAAAPTYVLPPLGAWYGQHRQVFVAWIVVSLIAVVSLVVYVAHCT